jgi:negative regulator of genetic competence, sporulation and motility
MIRSEVMAMDKKVEVLSTEKGIQINITADDAADIQEIQAQKRWYSDILRERKPESERAEHHREHHGSHAHHGR